MIIVDKVLEERQAAGDPIVVGLVGAGFAGQALARQLAHNATGIRLGAVANRTQERAWAVLEGIGVSGVTTVETAPQIEDILSGRGTALVQDAMELCRAGGIDAIIDATGSVEYGARIALEAIAHGKHVIEVNAELDGTLGPILNRYARQAGVVYTTADGDQPGVTLNLVRFLRGIGVQPHLCGNIKGLLDPYRTPETQVSFAEIWGQNPQMVASFADGSKISFEQAIIANATGMGVAQRGMIGPVVEPGTRIEVAAEAYPGEAYLDGPGIVDYVVGASPGPGVFVLGTHDDPAQRRYLEYYKMGDGPVYCFTRPFHLCHFEVQNSVARAVLFGDATAAPKEGPTVEVVAVAKQDLAPGDVLDGIGGFHAYGECDNTETVRRDHSLPIGVSEGCTLVRPVPRDQVITFEDVTVPEGWTSHRLLREQNEGFATGAPPTESRAE